MKPKIFWLITHARFHLIWKKLREEGVYAVNSELSQLILEETPIIFLEIFSGLQFRALS